MDHGKVQWPEILVEWHISKIIVNVEEKGILIILWRLIVRYPVQLICKREKKLEFIFDQNL